MIILKLRKIFFQWYIRGTAIWPFILIKKGISNEARTINHEKIHIAQQKEMLVIPFFILYFYYHLKYGYKKNPFEVEAFANQENFNYLKTRKRYAWKK